MIPSPLELATLAVKRREEFTRRLAELSGETGGPSLLPGALKRCIVMTAACQQVLSGLDRVVSATIRELTGSVPDSVEPGGETPSNAGFARLWRSHLSLAVNRAFMAYGEILRATDWRVRRLAMDSFLDFLISIEVIGGGTDRPHGLKPLTEGAIRIKALLEARRPQAGIAGMLFRDQESLEVEAMAWCYCATLIAQTLKTHADGTAGVKTAVKAVDALRADLEKSLNPAPASAPPRRPTRRSTVPIKR